MSLGGQLLLLVSRQPRSFGRCSTVYVIADYKFSLFKKINYFLYVYVVYFVYVYDYVDFFLTVSGTICVRIAIFPLVILAQRNAAHMHNHMPTMQRLQEKMTRARGSGDLNEGLILFYANEAKSICNHKETLSLERQNTNRIFCFVTTPTKIPASDFLKRS